MKKLILSTLLSLSCTFAAAESYLIDVRTAEEFNQAHAENAEHIPVEEIAAKIASITEDKQAEIHLYCKSGRRAEAARSKLMEMGYQNVRNLGTLADAQAFVEKQAQANAETAPEKTAQ